MAAAERLRCLLVAEFARCAGSNPRYSLRGFARKLGVDHSTLSQLLRGRRSLTWRTIRRLAVSLKWPGRDVLSVATPTDFRSRVVAAQIGMTVDDVNVALTDLCMLKLIQLQGV
jgi:hypothetical protein